MRKRIRFLNNDTLPAKIPNQEHTRAVKDLLFQLGKHGVATTLTELIPKLLTTDAFSYPHNLQSLTFRLNQHSFPLFYIYDALSIYALTCAIYSMEYVLCYDSKYTVPKIRNTTIGISKTIKNTAIIEWGKNSVIECEVRRKIEVFPAHSKIFK